MEKIIKLKGVKHGLNFIFNKDEYVKIDPLYADHVWYINFPLKIKKLNKSVKKGKVIFNYYTFYKNIFNIKKLDNSLVIQDNECIKLNRKEKIKKLNENIIFGS
jgi:hypothetical protein